MNENEPLTIERIDDVALLLTQLDHMQVAKLLDRHFPTHGNWQGLSLEMVSVVWMSHLLSEGDHWLNHVEPWAAQHLTCLQACLGQEVRNLDFKDDREDFSRDRADQMLRVERHTLILNPLDKLVLPF